jgi:hypothetical protein
MGFHPAWKYQQVHELVFERGLLSEARDATLEMARLRTRMQDELKPGQAATRHQIKEWIASCFRRDYSHKAHGE